MRIAHLTAAIVLAAFASPDARACHPDSPEGGRPRPSAFWSTPPTVDQLQSGEVALRLAFNRVVTPDDPAEQEFSGNIIIQSCDKPKNAVFDVIDVLGGEGHGRISVLVPAGARLDINRPELILVGRLFSLREESTFKSQTDAPWRLLSIRMPPQSGSP